MRRLHIGGKVRLNGWEVLNAIPDVCVDHVGDARDLSRFEDNTFEDIYASHVVEHFDYNGELENTLREWHRVLAPNGRLGISVPDLDVLARLFVQSERLAFDERLMLMRMIFGGHINEYDHHKVGLSHDLLSGYLMLAGFKQVEKVKSFEICADSSSATFKGVPISLNIVAVKTA